MGYLNPKSVPLSPLAHCFPTVKELFWSRGKESLQDMSQGHQVLGRAKARGRLVSLSALGSRLQLSGARCQLESRQQKWEVHVQNKPIATCCGAAQSVRVKNEAKLLCFLKVWALTTA